MHRAVTGEAICYEDKEGNVVYLILLIVLLTVVSLFGLWLMIKAYYWGPTGQPPQYRGDSDKPGQKTGDKSGDAE